MSDVHIRCFGCDRVFNITRSPFCADCERCANCGQQLTKGKVECDCNLPHGGSLERIIQEHAIPASDVEFEIQLDRADKRLLYPKIIFFTLTHTIAMALLKAKFNVTTLQGFVAMMATFFGTMVTKRILFDALAKSMAEKAMNSGADVG